MHKIALSSLLPNPTALQIFCQPHFRCRRGKIVDVAKRKSATDNLRVHLSPKRDGSLDLSMCHARLYPYRFIIFYLLKGMPISFIYYFLFSEFILFWFLSLESALRHILRSIKSEKNELKKFFKNVWLTVPYWA